MYRFTKNGIILSTLSNPVFVLMQNNGSFRLCEKKQAQGVVLDGTVYHLFNTPELDGHETVIMSEISEEAYRREIDAEGTKAKAEQNEADIAYISMETGVDL